MFKRIFLKIKYSGREPEGMWNLLSIVREMYKRNDRNSIPLLEIVTLQCLETAQIMIWWFNTKVGQLYTTWHVFFS